MDCGLRRNDEGWGRPVTEIRISAHQARLLHLAAQDLLARPRRRARKADVLAAITRMRMLQIDTINIVARSPYFVLFSRLGAYKAQWLDETLAAGAIFEWLGARSVLRAVERLCAASPPDDRASGSLGDEARAAHARASRRPRWIGCSRTSANRARSRRRISNRSRARRTGGWWGWKDEKRWLEALFALGEIMITRRDKFSARSTI